MVPAFPAEPDIHVSHLSRENARSEGALARARTDLIRIYRRAYASRLMAPASCRTRDPLAASSPGELSPKIECVFTASPETIRREPREFALCRSVPYLRDLAACAPKDPDVFPFLGRGF